MIRKRDTGLTVFVVPRFTVCDPDGKAYELVAPFFLNEDVEVV